MSAVGHPGKSRPRPWWLELMLVDFRHAFWPWLAYVAAIVWHMRQSEVQSISLISPLVVMLAGPAVVTQIFCADFAYGTAATVLTFPRHRNLIWIARFTQCLLLLGLPLLVITLHANWLSQRFEFGLQQTNFYHTSVRIPVTQYVTGVWVYLTIAPLLAVVLRKPLQTWSAIIVSPIALGFLWYSTFSLIGLNVSSTSGNSYLLYPTTFFWFGIVVGLLAIIFAWRLWLRMEVRS